jgi:hypothetical protein
MSNALPLGLDAVDLVLSIAESRGMAISATALDDFHKELGPALLAAGAIKLDGFEAVAVPQSDHDDAIVSLTWSSELRGYAYFSPTAGLVRIDDDRLRRFKLDTSWFLQWVARHLGSGTGAQPVCLIADRFWDLGDIWLGATKRMRRRTAVYLARRLTESETVAELAAVLRMHRTRLGKVILTTSNNLDLARTIIADTCAILPIKTCARAGIKHFELDPNIIYSAAHGLRAASREMPVEVDADFRMVRVGDRQFRFRGDKQRQVVRLLYQRWRNSDGPISISAMFEELEFSNSMRLRDLFKDHSNWRELIGDRAGASWLRCDEILAEAEDKEGAPI